jgi:acyl-CoA reductase-like NAD-dependent aldehyde dehydrogenase
MPSEHSCAISTEGPEKESPSMTARIDPAWFPTEPYPQLVAGQARRAGRLHPVLDPSTGETHAQWAEATPEEVDAALAAARRAFDEGDWRRMAPGRRAEVLDAVAARIRQDASRLAALEAADTGKAVGGARVYDVHEAATAFSYAAGVGRDLHGDVRRAAFPPDLLPGGGPDVLTMRLREPAGVVVELLPWNGPLMTGSQRIAAALAAGCSLVVKPPEEAVVSVLELAGILADCGLPPGTLNVVLGPGETVGAQLVSDPRVDLISLTGGVETGARVMAAAARNITPVHLELGGKSPVLVFPDADLEQAAGWAMMAAFVNMGEVCVAGSRLLVHESVYEEVVARVAEQAGFLPIGDALDPGTFIGPLISEAHADRVRGFVDRALADGSAQLVGGGAVPAGSPDTFAAPLVLGRVRPGCELEQTEVFGPVLAAASFADEDEAVALANGTRYGLNATVFTRDIERAFQLADRLDCGEVNVNCHFAPDMNGGRGEPRRMSGASRTGVEAYTALKAINVQVRG